MGKFNDTYLKPALDSLKANADSIIKSADSVTNRVNAESVSITDKSKAELTYKRNISTGYKYALILVGVGVLSVFLAWAAAIVINALKAEPKTSPKVAEIQQQVDKSNKTLENLSTAVNSQNQNYQTNLTNLVNEFRNMQTSVAESQTKLVRELAVIKSEITTVGEIENSKPANYSGYSLETFTLNEQSQSCHDNVSFSKTCSDIVKFENGWSYSGMWRNGMPNGDGKITFPGGAELQASFEDGVPIKVSSQEKEEVDILKSITHFHSNDASKINNRFSDVVIGYKFDTGTDTTWKSAYCYLEVKAGNDVINVSLSRFMSFSGRLIENYYSTSPVYSASEFNRAKKLCKYKRVGFH